MLVEGWLTGSPNKPPGFTESIPGFSESAVYLPLSIVGWLARPPPPNKPPGFAESIPGFSESAVYLPLLIAG